MTTSNKPHPDQDFVVASAPGKLVLMGEYAVLFGAPGIVTAVDVRATALVLGVSPIVSNSQAPRLLQAVSDEFNDSGYAIEPEAFAIDTTAFRSGDRKLGFGSSSAAVVAAVAATIPNHGRASWHRYATDAHARFAGGGSGIDVLASTYGGTHLCVARDGLMRSVSTMSLPPALAILVVDVGYPQDTTQFVTAVQAHNNHLALCKPLADATAAFVDAVDANDVAAIMRAVDAARDGMAALGMAASIDIVSAPHQRVAEIAHMFGGAAKPSGAGGGDVALAFVPAPQSTACRSALAQAGFAVIDVKLGAEGARIESSGMQVRD